MKELKGMRVRGKKVFVRDPEEEKDEIPYMGEYARMIQLHLEEDQPKILEKMKQAGTIIPYLKKMQDVILDKVLETIKMAQDRHPEIQGKYLKTTQLHYRVKMETEEAIFHDLFPIPPETLPLELPLG